MGNYEVLIKDYYRYEDILTKEIKSLGSSPQARTAMEAAMGDLRRWAIESLQSQDQRLRDMENALRETRGALQSAQERMEGMERDNARAATVLFGMAGRETAPAASAGPTQEMQKRIEEQEVLLRRRESELVSLRKQFAEAQKEMDSVVERLNAQEEAARAQPAAESAKAPRIILPPLPPGEMPGVGAGDVQELRRLLAASEERTKQLEQEMEYLRLARRQIEEARDELAQRVKGLEAEFQGRFSQYEAALDQEKLQRQQAEAVAARLQGHLKAMEGEKNRLVGEYTNLTHISTGAKGEAQKLQALLNEALNQKKQQESELNALRNQLLGVQSERDEIGRRLKELEEGREEAEAVSSAVSDDQMERLKRRIQELEAQLKERDPGVDALRQQLQENKIFRDGLIQRIQILEAARAAQARVEEEQSETIAGSSEALSKWGTEKHEMEERLIIMQRDLANVRRMHENSERDWVETLTRQDTMRLKQIAEMKDEIGRLRAALGK